MEKLSLGGLVLLVAGNCVLAQQRFQVGANFRDLIRSGVTVPSGATCKRELPAYMVMDNMDVISETGVVYTGLTEEDCSAMCTDNMNNKNRPVLCAAFSYDHITFECIIHRSKGAPDGILPLHDAPGRRYFEKFCLPQGATPVTCGEAHFYREHQYVLVGFAQNVTITDSLEECVKTCVAQEPLCKSAMYFFAEGECITNSESAQDFPEVFAREEKDKVVYFENGCIPQAAREVKAAVQKFKENRRRTVIKPAPVEEESEPQELGYGKWQKWSRCDRADGRRVRRRECLLAKCSKPVIQVQWCADLDSSERLVGPEPTTTPKPKTTTTAVPTTTTTLPLLLIHRGWGPWEEVCLPFGTPVCQNGNLIGFQRRSCQGSPFQCQGPFFRYCSIPC